MLKKAWNAEGSPFAGTQFDPSKISLKKIKMNEFTEEAVSCIVKICKFK